MTSTDDRRALERHFTYRLNTLSKLNDLASQALYSTATGLTLPEARALAALGAFHDLTVNQLALEVNLDKGQASRLARAMEDKGLLARASNDDDRREVRLKLTRQGRARWKTVMRLIEARNRRLLKCLSATEQTQLLAFFDRLLEQERAAYKQA